jgi:hypothetical protein
MTTSACWVVMAIAACAAAGGTSSRVGIYGRASVTASHERHAASAVLHPKWSLQQHLEIFDSGAVVCLPRIDKHWFWLFYAAAVPMILLALLTHTRSPPRPHESGVDAWLAIGLSTPGLIVPMLALCHCARRLVEHALAGDVASTLAGTDHTQVGESATMGPMTYLGGFAHYVLLAASLAALTRGLDSRGVEVHTLAGALIAAALAAEGGQWVCHSHLRSMRLRGAVLEAGGRLGERGSAPVARSRAVVRKTSSGRYSLPSHACFSWCLNPHYTAEAVSYWLWALVALVLVSGAIELSLEAAVCAVAPMFGAAVWTSTNLALSGRRSLRWYREKFGSEAVGHRGALLCIEC